ITLMVTSYFSVDSLLFVLFYFCTIHSFFFFFFFNDPATTEIYTLSLHDALPISFRRLLLPLRNPYEILGTFLVTPCDSCFSVMRSEEHTSELQSLRHLVCRLLLEKKKKNKNIHQPS